MMASPTSFVARMRIFTPPLPRGCERLIKNVSEISLWRHLQVDHRDVDRGFLNLRIVQILCVLFGGHKRVRTSLLPYSPDLQDVTLCIAMVIGEDCLAANGKPPISEIAEERVGIAEAAEGKKTGRRRFHRRREE